MTLLHCVKEQGESEPCSAKQCYNCASRLSRCRDSRRTQPNTSDVAQEQRMLHVQVQLDPWPWSSDKVEFKPMRVYHLYNDRKEAGNSEYSYRTTTDPPSICSVPATDSRSHSESDTTSPVQHRLNHSQTLLVYDQVFPQHRAQHITPKLEWETSIQTQQKLAMHKLAKSSHWSES